MRKGTITITIRFVDCNGDDVLVVVVEIPWEPRPYGSLGR